LSKAVADGVGGQQAGDVDVDGQLSFTARHYSRD
jgi:hypothetical protein